LKKIIITVGTRPNFIKVTRFKEVVEEYPNLKVKIIHTGQHYDYEMSEIFFEQFGLKPDLHLKLKREGVVAQFSEIMLKLSQVFLDEKPDIVLVPGDVNSTFASAFAAHKLGIKVGHIESGLRSFDRSMPEEINRILTDDISNLFFTTEPSGTENLINEGKDPKNIHFVGNTMIDTIVKYDTSIESSSILKEIGLENGSYALFTFHRPANVDDIENQLKLIQVIEETAKNYTCVFPVHPRTKKALEREGLYDRISRNPGVKILDPLGYLEFQKLIRCARFVLTDSGGIQEETTFYQIPCITLRPNTERPITMESGSNVLMTFELDLVLNQIQKIKSGKVETGKVPGLWDGEATNRIVSTLSKIL
jgi:UDP-N-acetylglucosamine 2-epimerase (non-hydrolysing)